MELLMRRERQAGGSALAALLAFLLACAAGCGGGGIRGPRFLPGPAGRIHPIYDALVIYPDTTLIINGMSYKGIELDLELEFDDPTLRDGDPHYTAEARVTSLRAGGVPQHYVLQGPLRIEGTLTGESFTTGLFGGIQVGTANLLPELTGTLDPTRSRIDGDATLFGLANNGIFTAIKRRRYLMTGTDLLSIGKVSVVSVRYGSRFSIAKDLAVVTSDPVARVEDGRPFVVNRYSFDTLQGFDPRSGFATSFEYSTGNGSNPHDMVVFPAGDGGTPDGLPEPDGPGLAFVTRYEPPFNDVAIVDLNDGTIIDTIDLTPYALGTAKLPRADQALLHEGMVYVTLQDANARFTEFETGRVAVIDPVLRDVVDVIDLDGQNPLESFVYLEETGLFYAGMAGIFQGLADRALTGGVEAIDPLTRRSLGLVVDDDDLGGNVSAIAIHSATRGYAVVTDDRFRNSVRVFDPSTGSVGATVLGDVDRVAALVLDGDGFLLIAEGYFSPRLIVLDADTGHLEAILPLSLPPFSIDIMSRGL
ncbi:MAG TPA: hypothetical protein VFG08_06985 [Candidatus Polarisedimenticolia bacterium]|nr:hypothetical protein [Candidatus Polarisedimenticolia bacterium]